MNLHNFGRVPVDGVVVEISSWVEPTAELLLPVSLSLNVDVRVESVRLSRDIAQKFKIDLIVKCSS